MSNNLTENAKAAKNAYARAWRAKNRDKVREINARYWERKAAELAEKEGEENGRCFDSQSNSTTGES